MDEILPPSVCEEAQKPAATPPADQTIDLTLQSDMGTPFTDHSEQERSHITQQARVLFTPLSQQTPPPSKGETPVLGLSNEKHSSSSPTHSGYNPTTPKSTSPTLTKAERDAIRAEARAKREAEKLKREQESIKKEQDKKERREKREQEMRERQEKREREELEKKERKGKKEAERRKREDERKKREEERKKSEMEKEMAKEEKTRKERMVKERFMGFFSKLPKGPPAKRSDVFSILTPFSVKPDMILARLPARPPLNSTAELETLLLTQTYSGAPYLTECKGHRLSSKALGKNELDDDVIITWPPPSPRQPAKRRMKLLQFHSNYRPAYFGTWSKHSTHLSPRNPFKLDKGLLDYDVDSDEEWEEEEPGESVSDSEGEGGGEEVEGGAEEGEDEDGFLVPHGYLSEGEGDQSEGEEEGEANEARKQKQLAKAKAWEAEFSRKCQQLKPKLVGPVWCTTRPAGEESEWTKDEAFLRQFEAVSLVEGPISIGEPSSSSSSSASVTQTGGTVVAHGNAVGDGTKRAVPEEAMPDLVRLVHGSATGLVRLIKAFRTHWGAKMSAPAGGEVGRGPGEATPTNPEQLEQQSGISKRQLEFKIQAMAVKEVRAPHYRPLWYVHESVFKTYGLDPSTVMPLVPQASPAVAMQRPPPPPMLLHGKASSSSSPETPSLVKKGLKRKTDGIQTVKALFETISKSPADKTMTVTPATNALPPPQTTPTRPRPCIITTLLPKTSPPVTKKPRLDSDWSDPQQLAKFAAQYIPQIILAGLLTNGNTPSIPANQNAAGNLLTNENASEKTVAYLLPQTPPTTQGNTLHELTNLCTNHQ